MLPQSFVIVVVAALVLAALMGVGPRRGWLVGAGVVAFVSLVALWAAWPLLDLPFDTDAPVLRAAFAAVDVFGDWNHPFLPYLLNRPTTWISLAPRALRMVPLAFLLGETALIALAAMRARGPLAGTLAGAWFACEIRRRHGLVDLGDWDVAGAFLMAMVLWCAPRREGSGRFVVVAVLLAGGVFSSWLMIVPATVMVACLAVEALRMRAPARPILLLGAEWIGLAVLALRVFVAGARSPEPGHAEHLASEIWVESPLAREALMVVPIAIGVVFAIRHFGALRERFALLSLAAIPAAVWFAFRTSHVNGGYYAGLATPLGCYLAGAGTAELIEVIRARVVGDHSTRALETLGKVAVAALVAIVGGASIDLPNAPFAEGMEDLPRLSAAMKGDALAVYTDSASLPRVLAFERARTGEGKIADVLVAKGGAVEGPIDLVARTHLLVEPCDPNRMFDQGPFYFVGFLHRPLGVAEACVERLGPRCQRLAGADVSSSPRVLFERCD